MLMLTRLAGYADGRCADEPRRPRERRAGELPHSDERHAGELRRPDESCAGELRLTYEWRQKSRARVTVAAGELAGSDIGLALPRGTVLRDGDVVATDDGKTRLRVRAATEQLLHVIAGDALTLLRIAYHLGNRHVPVQVGRGGKADRGAELGTDCARGRDGCPDGCRDGDGDGYDGADHDDGPWLRLALDHVLENMVQGLGGVITVVGAPFDPEQGAYGAHAGHHHDHDDHGPHGDRAQHVHAAGGARHDDWRHAPRIHDFTGDDR